MNAQSANSQLSFQLPSMSYIDAKWEEPNLRATPATARPPQNIGLIGMIAARVVAFRAWRLQRQTLRELDSMTDRELTDIGLTRSDFSRIFDDADNADLRVRGAHA